MVLFWSCKWDKSTCGVSFKSDFGLVRLVANDASQAGFDEGVPPENNEEESGDETNVDHLGI
jgi:hypothetical protein